MTKKHFTFLDKLRASGKVNMYAAGTELVEKGEVFLGHRSVMRCSSPERVSV